MDVHVIIWIMHETRLNIALNAQNIFWNIVPATFPHF